MLILDDLLSFPILLNHRVLLLDSYIILCIVHAQLDILFYYINIILIIWSFLIISHGVFHYLRESYNFYTWMNIYWWILNYLWITELEGYYWFIIYSAIFIFLLNQLYVDAELIIEWLFIYSGYELLLFLYDLWYWHWIFRNLWILFHDLFSLSFLSFTSYRVFYYWYSVIIYHIIISMVCYYLY